MRCYYTVCNSPLGPVLLEGSDTALERLCLHSVRPRAQARQDRAPFHAAISQLEEYFAGCRRQFQLPLQPQGTAFQLQVWELLQRIPYGETRSYGEMARLLGKPKASRAVGLACGANPLAIVIPCHRVIGSTGRLTGFAAGIDIKRRLLALEQGQAPWAEASAGAIAHEPVRI